MSERITGKLDVDAFLPDGVRLITPSGEMVTYRYSEHIDPETGVIFIIVPDTPSPPEEP